VFNGTPKIELDQLER